MSERAFNFNPGPAFLPDAVVREAQTDLWNFRNSGLGVMEISHRGKDFQSLLEETLALFRELMSVPDTHEILLIPAGATLQFSMVPMNLCSGEQVANHLVGGYWAQKCLDEAERLASTHVAGSSKGTNYSELPLVDRISENAAYLHYTSNNTIMGTQHTSEPEVSDIPLICDASSDILSKPVDVSRYGLIYACAQKNLGIAGITVVIIARNLLARSPKNLPILLDYNTYAANMSLYNTIPTFPVYIVNRMLQWLKREGGVKGMEHHNRKKANLVYQTLDEFSGFYRGHAAKNSRSMMNVAFFTPNPSLDELFVKEAEMQGLKGLKGHKILGGMRASLYNACPLDGAESLAGFMREFAAQHG